MSERIDVSVEELAEDIRINVVDIEDFNERVVGAYNDGTAEKGLEADDQVARSIIPAGNRRAARFQLHRSRYSGVHRRELRRLHGLRHRVSGHRHPRQGCRTRDARDEDSARSPTKQSARRWRHSGPSRTSTSTFWKRRVPGGGKFGIFIDPTKCKGCAECVDACGDHNALKMIAKDDKNMEWYKAAFNFYREHARNAEEVHQREGARRHDAGRAIVCSMSAAPVRAWAAAKPRRCA